MGVIIRNEEGRVIAAFSKKKEKKAPPVALDTEAKAFEAVFNLLRIWVFMILSWNVTLSLIPRPCVTNIHLLLLLHQLFMVCYPLCMNFSG